MKTLKTQVAAIVGLALLSSSAMAATTLIYDSFSGSGNLNGTTPTITTGGATWSTPATTFTESGGVLTADMTTARGAAINLGSNYFANHAGTYSLSYTIAMPAGSLATEWVSLGYSQEFGGQAMNSTGSVGYPWLVYRANGGLSVFTGPGTSGTKVFDAGAGTYTTGVNHTFSIVLNTSLTNWTFDVLADGVTLDLNGAGSAGTSYAFTSNPSLLQYVGISVPGGQSLTPTVDDFTLTYTPVPEPSIGALFVLSFLSLAFLSKNRRSRLAL